MINIQKQYYTRIRWSLTKASIWDRVKFKLTFGLFGRMEWLDRIEEDVVMYLAPQNERTQNVNMSKYGVHFHSSTPASFINCRCAMVEINND